MADRTLLSTFWVTNTDDNCGVNPAVGAGTGTLRQAIVDTNADTANSAADTIDFAIPGSGVHTIRPLTGLPYITHPVTIDGCSQPGTSPNTLAVGDNAVLNIELDGSLTSSGTGGLYFTAAGNTIRGLVVNRFPWNAIFFATGSDCNTVQGNFIGTDPTGEQGLGGGIGFYDSDHNLVGTDGDGLNYYAERNVVMSGIGLNGSYNVVAGDYLGTDASGSVALGNTGYGIDIEAYFPVTGNRIGVDGHDLDAAAERNIISGNQSGGVTINGIHAPCTNNVVAGNFVGTDATGTKALPNGDGPSQNGVGIGWSDGNRVGTDGDGVGDDLERNIISGNYWDGVSILGSNNVVAGNYIGTDVTGTQPLGNGDDGVDLVYGGTGNIIGINPCHIGKPDRPDWAGERNVIAANAVGIGIGETQGGHLIAGNWIGLLADGTPLANSGGIWVRDDTNDQIGGTPALANRIVDGPGVGVWVMDGTTSGISVRANSIVSDGLNGGVDNSGIYLTGYTYHTGPLVGPNNMQNYPVLSTAIGGSSTHVTGTLNSTPSTTFTLDFYANDPGEANAGSYGQGHDYLGSATVATDSSGNATFDISSLGASTTGQWISATATDPGGNTSEFSADVQAVKADTTTAITSSANPSRLDQPVTFTATVGAINADDGTPAGSVQFLVDGSNFGAPVPLVAGAAAVTTSTLSVGPHAIGATYLGDSSFNGSSAASLAQTVGYAFSGFLAPLTTGLSYAVGRTIPIKFQLTDYNSAPITSLSAVTSLQVAPVHPDGSLGTPFKPAGSGGTNLRFDSSANQFVFNWSTKGLATVSYAILLSLADGTTDTKTLQLTTSSGASGLTTGTNGGTGSAPGGLLGGDIALYVDNSNGDLTADELARIQDAVAAVDALAQPYGVAVAEVTDASLADVTLNMDTTSAVGGYADGVLGCTSDGGQITIIKGWDFYSGSDSTQVGAGQYDFETVVMHELGHALGVGHSADPTSVMYATLDAGTANRVMTTADLNVPDSDTGGACGLHAAGAPGVARLAATSSPLGNGAAAVDVGRAWMALVDLAARDVASNHSPGSRPGAAKQSPSEAGAARRPSGIRKTFAGSVSHSPNRTVLQRKIVDLALDRLERPDGLTGERCVSVHPSLTVRRNAPAPGS
jgi:hypothetical protein